MDAKYEIIAPLVEVEFYPSIIAEEIDKTKYKKFPISELSGLGMAFANLPECMRTVTNTTPIKGLYKCKFPDGVIGKLAYAKDGSGALGTILRKGGGLAQARWIPATDTVSSTVVPFDPTTAIAAAMLVTITKKLDKIEETQEKIFKYLEEDKKAEVEGDLLILSDIMNNLKYNWNDTQYKTTKSNLVNNIKRTAQKNILFFEKQIEKELKERKFIHINMNVDSQFKKINSQFKYYQMSMYEYAFASYIDVLLVGNFNEKYLKSVLNDINSHSNKYRLAYTECYNQIENYTTTSIESQFMKGLGDISESAGKMFEQIPLINKTGVDKGLIGIGKESTDKGKEKSKVLLKKFKSNKDASTRLFSENIKTISNLYNKPSEMFIEGDYIYLNI